LSFADSLSSRAVFLAGFLTHPGNWRDVER
jgi:hypothetical protein